MSDGHHSSERSQRLAPRPIRKRAARSHGFVLNKRVAIGILVASVIVLLISLAFSTGKVGNHSRTAGEEAAYQAEKHRDEDGADAPDTPAQASPAGTPQKSQNTGD